MYALQQSLSLEQLQRLINLLAEKDYSAGDYIIQQGQVGETFFILLSGSCDCTISQPDGSEKTVFQPKLFDYFGERALLTSEPRAANVFHTFTRIFNLKFSVLFLPITLLYIGHRKI